jgi:hypothetical protein
VRDKVEAGKRAGAHKKLNTGTTGSGLSGRAIRSCLQGQDATTLQNTLMRMPDKVCAVGLAEITPEERDPIYALLAPQKARRVKDEIRYIALRHTEPVVHTRIIRAFLSYFGKAPISKGRIWIRPRKP